MHPLEDARKRRVPWPEVAQAVRLLEREKPSSGLGAPPIRIAERMSGYSANHLRRMVVALDFLDELQKTDPDAADWLGMPRFSIAETLAKLWRQDKDATRELLNGKPVLRYEALYGLFHERIARGASPASSGKQAGRQFRERWLSNLKSAPGEFAPFGPGTYSIIQPRLFHRYCRPTLLLKLEPSPWTSRWAGIDFFDRPKWEGDAMWRRLMQVATESTFLDAWCIVVAHDPQLEREQKDTAYMTRTMVHELGLPNILVIPVSERKSGSMAHSFSRLYSPALDRRDQWRSPELSTVLMQYHTAEAGP